MIRSKLLLAAGLCLVAIPLAARADQDPVVLPNAVHTIDLNVGSALPATPMGVAFYPGFGGRYYATLGGNPSYVAYVFNAAGTNLQVQSLNIDCRGIGYNWNTGNLEVTAFSANSGGGLFSIGLTATGLYSGTNTNVLGTLSGLPDAQSMPATDAKRNRLYARGQVSPFDVNIVNRATGALISTVHLDTTGLGLAAVAPAGPTGCQGSAIGFDSTYSCIISIDPTRPRVLVHRLDGSFVGASMLPAIAVNGTYGMGYANGQVFIANNGGTGWFGYRIFNPPNATSSTASSAANTFALVGVTVEPADTTIVSHFGGADTTSYRLGHFMPGKQAYAMPGFYTADGREITGIHPGLGYWMIAHSARDVSIAGSSTPSTWVTPLLGGPAATASFNQLANPFDVAVPVASLRVRQGTTEFYVVNGSNTLSDQVVWTWNGSAYASQSSGNLAAGQGFWLRKSAGAPTDVVFARPGVNPEPALVAGGAEETSADPRLWSLALTVHQGDAASNALVLGAAALDRAGLEAISWPIPPAPPGGSLRLVARADGNATDLGAAFQTPAATMAWEVVISGAASPGEIAVDAVPSGVPTGSAVRWIDETTGETSALVAGGPLTLGDRRYRVEIASAGGAAAPAGAGTLRVAYPNPFRANVGLTFAIGRAGDVAVDVFDLQGRLVRSLSRRGLSAGEHVLVWDGHDDSGSLARTGVYLARWSTPDDHGTTRLVKID